MLRTVLALSLFFTPVWAVAADLAPIRTDFDTDYDVKPYRIGIVMARHKAAVFDFGRSPEPLMDPAYGRRVPVDHELSAALGDSMQNLFQDTDSSRFQNVQMMTNAAETLIVACGTVRETAANKHDSPFVAMFTNPHASQDVHSVGFSASPWISETCQAMGIN